MAYKTKTNWHKKLAGRARKSRIVKQAKNGKWCLHGIGKQQNEN
jgi:hypothetical protein